MIKEGALHAFWSSFGLTAYDENSVPDSAVLPYITYNVGIDKVNYPVSLVASLWYKDTSWQAITDKCEEIAKRIINGGEMVHYDGGAIWITGGTPFANRISTTNDTIKRISINIEAEFIG